MLERQLSKFSFVAEKLDLSNEKIRIQPIFVTVNKYVPLAECSEKSL
jgi:hypothetical protein